MGVRWYASVGGDLLLLARVTKIRIPAKIKDVVIEVGIQIFTDVLFMCSDLSTRCLTDSFSIRRLPMFVWVRFLDLLRRSEILGFHVGI